MFGPRLKLSTNQQDMMISQAHTNPFSLAAGRTVGLGPIADDKEASRKEGGKNAELRVE